MVILEFFGNIVTTILIGYLAFTNSLADTITHIIETNLEDEATEVAILEPPHPSAETTISQELLSLSKQLATSFTGEFPRILLENREYQEAAVGANSVEETAPITPNLSATELIESSLVNVFCQYKTENYIRTTTGTGFFIHTKGVILTNAHVAQFLLLKGSDSDVIESGCVIRTGNPATPQYKAELLYISPMWIYQNASLITDETPRGTGERDYALLYISGSVGDTKIPESFPAIPVDTALLSIYTKGIDVITAGYPAESLFREGARAKLVPVVASTTIGELYTFGSDYADIFEVSESPVGAQGASGGPVTRTDGRAIGLIVTKGNERTDGAHSLRAITLSYIDRTIIEETGFSLLQNMQGDLAFRGDVFKKALVPFLSKLLTDEIVAKEGDK